VYLGPHLSFPVYCPSWEHKEDPKLDLLSEYWLVVNDEDDKQSKFNQYWSQTKTVPFFLLLFIVPLINFKSPTFFTKFNALG
jgi:sodium-coupled neutral amino acid transporter 9